MATSTAAYQSVIMNALSSVTSRRSKEGWRGSACSSRMHSNRLEVDLSLQRDSAVIGMLLPHPVPLEENLQQAEHSKVLSSDNLAMHKKEALIEA